jgi:hypothetical protein
LSGTSLAGALRARCTRIAQTLLDKPAADNLVEGLFGPLEVKGGNGRASRLRVGESVVEEGQSLRHTRVRIDPWTGGAADALLFTSEPIYLGRVKPVLRWRKPPEGDPARECAERGLLLLTLRDMALGDLHLGGESATGRGRVAPLHEDGTFGSFGQQSLKLTTAGGLEGVFDMDLEALAAWTFPEGGSVA